ncbi:MAG: hypothetical protein ACI92G_000356 [Candidatus Pelagisphaera sp.]|jgi:hypothetical protein
MPTRKKIPSTVNAERKRLDESASRTANWKRWGPYISERQWGTVREDYSADGEAWDHLPFEESGLRAYRWGEDGLLGFCDRECRLCFSLAFWNGKDERLKERLFGLNGNQGNHGEDCKELYYYLDSTPSHSYSKALYKYPQAAFPYDELRKENERRGKNDSEYEILDTGVFDENRYFDIQVEYSKAGPDDILIRLVLSNRGPDSAKLHALPKIFYRNTWIWGCEHEGCTLKPSIRQRSASGLELSHQTLDGFRFEADKASDGTSPEFVFTENETNTKTLYGTDSYTPYVKDGIERWLLKGEENAVNPAKSGTIAASHYDLEILAGESVTICFRLFSDETPPKQVFGAGFESVFKKRREEADAFYASVSPEGLSEEEQLVERQAYAGLLWSKQFYHYSVHDWLRGDPGVLRPPSDRLEGRNHEWKHLFNRDVISMPDKWEYPWYAAWDLAFHMIPFARIDPDFAKKQLILFLREWYMHPNGQIPAYEWALGDVNPPVHAWACLRVYRICNDKGKPDVSFLKKAFHKLMLNFTWWVNRKDPEGNNLFAGGFLGLDNIGLFDRSKPLPEGHALHQADGTAWMAFYCSTMLAIALELAAHDPDYEDVASKFFEHFMSISDAMNHFGESGLWDEKEGFYYDEIVYPNGESKRIRVRSLVGLIPLIAAETLEGKVLESMPGFRKRMNWYLEHRKDLAPQISCELNSGEYPSYLLAVPTRERLERVLTYLFDEDEFLSTFGVRSLSRYYKDRPYGLKLDREEFEVRYTPGDSDSWLFGGNSNWRGPIWFPIAFLIIEALRGYHRFYGDSLKAEFPTRSGNWLDLDQCADELSKRMGGLFLPDGKGQRPCHGDETRYADDPNFRNLPLFYEFFHGETGKGLGASHQTGWTSLVAEMLRR